MSARAALLSVGLILALCVACSPAPSPSAAPTASPVPSPPHPITLPPPHPATPSPSHPTTLSPPHPSIPSPPPALPGAAWNFELVGHPNPGGGWPAGLALAGHCAYLGNRRTAAISILDISDPAHPIPLDPLRLPPGAQPVELRTTSNPQFPPARPAQPGRAISNLKSPIPSLLLVADLSPAATLYTFDISDCAHPVPLGSLALARAAHEFFLWRSGGRVLAFVATFHAAPPDLLVIDLSDPRSPHEVGRWSAAEAGLSGPLHSLSVSADGSRAYLALSGGGFAVAAVGVTDEWVVLSAGPAVPFPGAHSAVPLAPDSSNRGQADPRYALLTAESYTCPFSAAAIA
ncbi:MAG: hypothetical protein HY784_19100, partial [Chloroflexi bacterium]|nr:hypothetical protein [Chloroflexota bacterium]